MNDDVNKPAHYQGVGGIECIDVIAAFSLNYHTGNAVKYILRHQKKGAASKDLRKAIYYLTREAEILEKAGK